MQAESSTLENKTQSELKLASKTSLSPPNSLLRPYPVYQKELWTAQQRKMHPLHYAISYRASFKPELPDFFIQRYLGNAHQNPQADSVVLDPFGGRGTTALQANLLGFRAIHNDLNPVSVYIAQAKQSISSLEKLMQRAESLPLDKPNIRLSHKDKAKLLPFFHIRTLEELSILRSLVLKDISKGCLDRELCYIAMTALSRLHGHSDGFFSVFSFPQISVMPQAQMKNNLRLGNTPEYKAIIPRLIRKMKRDLKVPLTNESASRSFHETTQGNRYLREDASQLSSIADNSVDLIVTSPPFLDKVDYQQR